MSYILQTARLTKNIGGKTLVSDVDLHIRKGEIYGFLGDVYKRQAEAIDADCNAAIDAGWANSKLHE